MNPEPGRRMSASRPAMTAFKSPDDTPLCALPNSAASSLDNGSRPNRRAKVSTQADNVSCRCCSAPAASITSSPSSSCSASIRLSRCPRSAKRSTASASQFNFSDDIAAEIEMVRLMRIKSSIIVRTGETRGPPPSACQTESGYRSTKTERRERSPGTAVPIRARASKQLIPVEGSCRRKIARSNSRVDVRKAGGEGRSRDGARERTR